MVFFWIILQILPSSSGFGEAVESEQRSMMGTQRMSLSDHTNTFQYTAEKNDSFVIDMDAFSPGINKDSPNANSRITVTHTLSLSN